MAMFNDVLTVIITLIAYTEPLCGFIFLCLINHFICCLKVLTAYAYVFFLDCNLTFRLNVGRILISCFKKHCHKKKPRF